MSRATKIRAKKNKQKMGFGNNKQFLPKGAHEPKMGAEEAMKIIQDQVDLYQKHADNVKLNYEKQKRVITYLTERRDQIVNSLVSRVDPTIYVKPMWAGATGFSIAVQLFPGEDNYRDTLARIVDPVNYEIMSGQAGFTREELFEKMSGLTSDTNPDEFNMFCSKEIERAGFYEGCIMMTEILLGNIMEMVTSKAKLRSDDLARMSMEVSITQPTDIGPDSPEIVDDATDAQRDDIFDKWRNEWMTHVDAFCTENAAKLTEEYNKVISKDDIVYLIQNYMF